MTLPSRPALNHEWEQGDYIFGGTLEGRIDWHAIDEMEQHAKSIIEDWYQELDKMVLAWSGGADSVVILHLLYRLDLLDVTPVSVFTPEFFPCVVEYAGKLAHRWGFDPEIIYARDYGIEWVASDPDRNLFPEHGVKQRMLENSFRGVLSDYNQDNNVDLYLSGHRNEHNRTDSYVWNRWGAYQGSPLRTWKFDHILAYCHQYSIPLSPLYRTGASSGGRPWHRARSKRGDTVLHTHEELFYRTRTATVRYGYTSFWKRILDYFPEGEEKAVQYAVENDLPFLDVEEGYDYGCDANPNPRNVGPET